MTTLEQLITDYRCDFLTDRCAARDHAHILQFVDGEPVCERPCCLGCQTRCGYYCGYADATIRELEMIANGEY